jgi:PLP dependent protein
MTPASGDAMTPASSDVRRGRLAEGLRQVQRRIDAACVQAGRRPAEVHLVVVTKTYPVTDIAILADLGVHDVGESRDQEAAPKAAALAGRGLRWHFVGRLQSNKARHVAGYAHVVHSLDRLSLVGPLGQGAEQAGRRVDCLLQVSLDGDPARGGCRPVELPALAEAVAAQVQLRVCGIMAVAPTGADPWRAFAVLAPLSASLRESHPQADVVSAGMSGDLEAAIGHGATHLRVGSAVLGARPALG